MIICVVIAIAIGLFYISGYTPKAKVDNTEYVVVIDTDLDYEEQITSIVKQLCRDENGEERFNELEKYKILHDFTAKAIKYEYEAVRPGGNLTDEGGANDPYRALNTGNDVCGSYATVYRDLCKEAGLNCEYVEGKAFIPGNKGISGHAWNVVKIGSNWYHTDCYWSDTGGGLYEYYLRGERFIQVSDGGNFREMYTPGYKMSETDYKFDRDQNYASIVIQRK